MSKFQEFISNKQVVDLQEQLELAKNEIQRLKNQIDAQEEIAEIYMLRDKLIKTQNENLSLKTTILNLDRQRNKSNHLDEFFEYFNVPQIQNIGLRLQMIVDQFVNLREEIQQKNLKLLEYSQLQVEYKELLTKVTILEQHQQLKQTQLDKAEKQITYLTKIIEKYQNDANSPFWDLRIKSDTLKQLINQGWECIIGENRIEIPKKVVALVSEQFNMLSKRFSHQISDNHIYFINKDETLYILKHIYCTQSPITSLKKQIEALDEFWLMFILIRNIPINILMDSNLQYFANESQLYRKLVNMKQTMNSESQIYINQEIAYEMNVDFQNMRFQISQFAQQSFDWFFQKIEKQSIIVSDYNRFIKLSGQGKVKIAREITQLNYITDYYQITSDNRLMICLQTDEKEQPVVQKYQVNQGVIAKIKLKNKYNKICQIINTQITEETIFQQSENYMYIYL